MNEIHLLIIWSKALNKKEKILKDLNEKFEVLRIYNVTWSDKNFSNNLSRFYGENLPKNSHKEKHCGKDTFCCIIIQDKNPIYESRPTSKGSRVVNTNLFDTKQLYRSWTGGGHKIHATDNTQETKVQLALLLGESYDKIIENAYISSKEIEYKKDLVGAEGWKSFDELFEILNLTTNYVVLRNFDNLEEQLTSKHPDVDLLVENKSLIIDILNAKKTTEIEYRVQYNVIIENKDINFDIRYIGDNYYDAFWEREILNSKILNRKGFFTPNQIHHFYSLIYHALVHKRYIADDYNKKLIEISKIINFELKNNQLIDYELLNKLEYFMHTNRYKFVEPYDLSVFFNKNFLKNKITLEISKERYDKYFKVKLRSSIKKYLFTFLYQLNLIRKKVLRGKN